jgi:hypothetical protein
MGEETRIHIRPQWDTILTYDVLEREDVDSSIFVGRQDLLDPICSSVAQLEKRGTFLISGYRGSGKTSLIIEALRRSKKMLTKGWSLFCLVINASEVSASLDIGSTDTGKKLQIDPRRLLIAFLRSLNQKSNTFPADLQERVVEAYEKAIALEYTRALSNKLDETRSTTREISAGLTLPNFHKAVAGITGLASFGLFGFGLLQPWINAINTAAVMLAAVSVLNLVASRKHLEDESKMQSQHVSLKFDNSLHQLENELKDILTILHEKKKRAVIVLEELDKIEDEDGKQLDAVIRYFKNLFTQAPALFFFVTDKSYYDLISHAIRQARRRRSYAVEHTFFMHRIFVGRPTTQECLDYLHEIVTDDRYKKQVKDISAQRLMPAAPANDPFVRLVKLILFRAANHLFDLKAELGRYIRTKKGGELEQSKDLREKEERQELFYSELVIGEHCMSEQEARLGIFHDLITDKARTYAFGGERHYANEVLQSCLYSVFDQVGSPAEQYISNYYADALDDTSAHLFDLKSRANASSIGAETGDYNRNTILKNFAYVPTSPARGMPKSVPLLELSELKQIQQAVDSLIEDLHRGGAFDPQQTNTTKGTFVWHPTAAINFKFIRRREKHEQEFLFELEKMSAILGGLSKMMPSVNDILKRISGRVNDVKEASEALPKETVDSEMMSFNSEAATLMQAAYFDQREQMKDLFGLDLFPIGTTSQAGGLYVRERYLSGQAGDVRQAGPRAGAVLLVQGSYDRLLDDLRRYVSEARNLERLFVVHVYASADQYIQQINELDAPNRRVIYKRIPLSEDFGNNSRAPRDHPLACELVYGDIWYHLPAEVEQYAATRQLSQVPSHIIESIHDLLTKWLRGESSVLWIEPGELHGSASVLISRRLSDTHIDEALLWWKTSHDPTPWADNPYSSVLSHLYAEGRVILLTDEFAIGPFLHSHTSKSRVIFIGPNLPDKLRAESMLTLGNAAQN